MNKHLPAKQFNEIKKTFQAKKQNGFVTAVNARIVHEWLGVKTAYTNWIKRRIEKYGFEEHIDYCRTEVAAKYGTNKNNELASVEYHCTPDMVKQLAMIESSEMGKLARLYFLDCEVKLIEKQEQVEYRKSLSIEFKPMTDAVLEAHEDPQHYHYSNESDMINRIVLGMSSKKYREHHEIGKKENVRDYMTTLEMKAVIELQRANTVFITMGESFQDRKTKLTMIFGKRFKDALIEEVKAIEA